MILTCLRERVMSISVGIERRCGRASLYGIVPSSHMSCMSTRKAGNHRMRNLLLENYPWILVSEAVRSGDFGYLLRPKLSRQGPCTYLYVLP